MESYLLMDLERTLETGAPCFWKGNKFGYTYKFEYAGIFSKELAEEIAKNDLDQKTVLVPLVLIHKILEKDFSANES